MRSALARAHLYKLQLDVLGQGLHRLDDPKQRAHDIHRGVPLPPKLLKLAHRRINVTLDATRNQRFDFDGVGLVADFEHFVRADKVEARVGRLEVVDCLTHVAFRGEDERR